MGEVLYNFYLKAGEIGGIKARTRLSVLTKITSMQASLMPDEDATIKEFEKAIKSISDEFGNTSSSSTSTSSLVDTQLQFTKLTTTELNKETAATLRKQIEIFADLTAQRNLYINDLKSTYSRITESIVEAINVERASIWLFNEEKTGIVSADLFVRSTREHSEGVCLGNEHFPSYFKAVATERTLAANNAHTDPRTCEFTEVYLKPLGIGALLDVPIWVNGEMIGVVCHEHVGGERKWSSDDENFAILMGNIVSMAIEQSKK